MTHRVTAIKCSYADGNLVLTSLGTSPRGTKVLLNKVTIEGYRVREPGSRKRVEIALLNLVGSDTDGWRNRADLP